MSLRQLRILIVIEQNLFPDRLYTLFKNKDGVLVCNIINYNHPSSKKFDKHRSDIAIIDLDSLDISGNEAIRLITNVFQKAQFIMLSLYVNISLTNQLNEAATRGFLEEGSKIYRFIESASLMTDRKEFLIKGNQSVHLSTREKQVLRLIAEGHTNPEIGDILNIQSGTAKGYRKSLINKFDVRNSAELMTKSLRNGLI